MQIIPYDRTKAVAYARRWALSRNPRYYDFENIGGDCTNFVSQCLYAGAGVMNYKPDEGWYYRSLKDRAAAWTSVIYLYRFLTENKGPGPFAEPVPERQILPGDLVQFGDRTGRYFHTAILTQVSPVAAVAAHSYDAVDCPLKDYHHEKTRFLHLQGVRLP